LVSTGYSRVEEITQIILQVGLYLSQK